MIMQKYILLLFISLICLPYMMWVLENNIIIRWEQYEQHLRKISKPLQKLMINSTLLPHQYVDGSTI